MKKTLYFISAFLFLGVFTSCEKFELDDHCPDENQEHFVDPQDLRVNDDSDSEETGKPSYKSDADDSQHGDDGTTATNGNDSGDDSDNPDDDDLINDDSDDEDEGGRPRNPNGVPAK